MLARVPVFTPLCKRTAGSQLAEMENLNGARAAAALVSSAESLGHSGVGSHCCCTCGLHGAAAMAFSRLAGWYSPLVLPGCCLLPCLALQLSTQDGTIWFPDQAPCTIPQTQAAGSQHQTGG